jgi:hypothetical protein
LVSFVSNPRPNQPAVPEKTGRYRPAATVGSTQ